MDKKFKKGQKVFYATTNLSSLKAYDHNTVIDILSVIERTVDACGKKQMTFENHGYDYAYGKKSYAPFDQYFETREEAYEYLDSIEDYTRTDGMHYHHLILREIFDDRDDDVFKVLAAKYSEKKSK
jgi:hypothetical protein